MPNGMSISFEMQPLLLREQNVNACASFVHATRCKSSSPLKGEMDFAKRNPEGFTYSRGASASPSPRRHCEYDIRFARIHGSHRVMDITVRTKEFYSIRTYSRVTSVPFCPLKMKFSFLIRTYSRVTSAKLNSFLSHSILLFADLYKVYQTIPIISSKSSELSLYFPDFFGANPCFSTP